MNEMNDDYASWIGSTRVAQDKVTPAALLRLAATMDWSAPATLPGDPIPPLWHWLVASPIVSQSDIGDDGHERLGLFLPPLPPATRMWAAGDIEFVEPLRVGDEVGLRSTVTHIERKEGRAGPLWFVEVAHCYCRDSAVAVREKQTLVYRIEEPDSGRMRRARAKAAPAGETLERYRINDTQLFRYSALTFNGHRIHLDRDYCRRSEGDPRLVVHGPLLATILARAATDLHDAPLRNFSFRAHYPTREGENFIVGTDREEADRRRLWIAGDDGSLRMSAEATYE